MGAFSLQNDPGLVKWIYKRRKARNPIYREGQFMNGSKIQILSSLEKVFSDSKNNYKEYGGFSMLKNEKKSFQVVFCASKGQKIRFDVDSPLEQYFTYSYVKQIPAKLTRPKKCDEYYIDGDRHAFPDLLIPLEDHVFTAEYTGFNSVWVQIAGEPEPGTFAAEFTCGTEKAKLTIEIIDAVLPKQELIYTNWFHTDCLMSYYGFPAFSPEYWQCAENFLRRAAEYGMNCVLTPLFTPPLDTQVGGERPTVQLVDVTVTGRNSYAFGFDKLDRWIEMCEKCGIQYFEMSHLFTQWGAKHAPKIMAQKNGAQKKIFGWRTKASGEKYTAFLQQFATSLKNYIDKKGIKDRCIFHVSDEPAKRQLKAYSKASEIIRKNFKGFKITDALSDFSFYKNGVVETPVPSTDHIDPFISKVPELWAYYCSAQSEKYVSNRFFDMPSERNRVIGFQLYKFAVKGFLHWGYNFYYTRFSKRLADPFTEPDAGAKFPAGDSFVVYPGKDLNPLDSLRLHVFYDGLQDMLALRLLENLAGRDKAIAVLEKGTDKPITFSEYPHSAEWLLSTRERINAEIKKYL